jgi:hypothetical protein
VAGSELSLKISPVLSTVDDPSSRTPTCKRADICTPQAADEAGSEPPCIPVALRPALAATGVVEVLALAVRASPSAILPLLGTGLSLDGVVSLLSLPIIAALVAEAFSFGAVLVLVVDESPRRGAGEERHMLATVRAIVAGGQVPERRSA